MRLILLLLMAYLCFSELETVAAAGKRPASVWNYYHFDGTSIVPGSGDASDAYLAVKESALPVIITNKSITTIKQVPISAGFGAVAGICYIQSSGGKLAGKKLGFKPSSNLTLTVSNSGRITATIQTDKNGYFVRELPVGKYAINDGRFEHEVTVESGKTSIMALRNGKRMVD